MGSRYSDIVIWICNRMKHTTFKKMSRYVVSNININGRTLIGTRDHTGIKIQLLMLYYAKLNGQIKIKVCGLVYAKT